MNIFQINRSDIEDRFDPPYYKDKPDFSKFIKLSKIAVVKGGKRIPLGMSYTTEQTNYLYLRVADMLDGDIDYSTLNHIGNDVFEILKSYEISKNDIALSIAGTIGKVIFLKNIPQNNKIILTENCAKIQIKDTSVLSQYLALLLILSITQKQIELNYIQTTIPKLGLDRIRNLYLPPIPPLSVQQTIVDLYINAQSQRKRKLEEAQKLLVGLNDYLLSELGIKLPKKDNSLSKRIFVTKFSELTSNRFDPKYILYLKDIHNFKYDIFPLKKFLIEKPQYGTAEIGIPRIKEQQPRYIRITDINDFGELDDSLGATAENCSDEYFLYENDLLFARSGATVGKTYLHKHLSYPAFFAGYMIRVRLDESTLLPDYLFAYTQTSFYKNWVDAIQRAAAQPNINAEEYASLPIPLPPIEKQREIAKHIQEIRNHAKQLKNEADMILQEAKQKVERMILGE